MYVQYIDYTQPFQARRLRCPFYAPPRSLTIPRTKSNWLFFLYRDINVMICFAMKSNKFRNQSCALLDCSKGDEFACPSYTYLSST